MFKVDLYDVLKAVKDGKCKSVKFVCRGLCCVVKSEAVGIGLFVDNIFIRGFNFGFGLKGCSNAMLECIIAVGRYKCVERGWGSDCYDIEYDFEGGEI